MKQILNYAGFVDALLEAGFSLGGGNSDGIFALIETFETRLGE